jgi:colanic acid/amylovoran biosynthesis glycosyltransferase
LLNQALRLGLDENVSVVKITPAIDVNKYTIEKSVFNPNKAIRILTVSRLHWIKGIEYVLEALSKVKTAGYSIEYTLVGEGEEYERLVYAAYQLGLTNEVKFVGKKEHSEIPQLMASHDIYIQYSVQEGFCNAVLEAQAAGMLCIVSDAEGLSENVLHEKTGWVVPKRQPNLLASKIETIYNSSQAALLKISKYASERVLQEYNLELQKKRFIQFYQS